MKHQDKRCHFCNRIYRGEGYNGNCTPQCWAVEEHKKIFPKAKSSGISELQTYDDKKVDYSKDYTVKKANERWTNREYKEPVLTGYKYGDKIERKRLYSSERSWMKKFKVVRG